MHLAFNVTLNLVTMHSVMRIEKTTKIDDRSDWADALDRKILFCAFSVYGS